MTSDPLVLVEDEPIRTASRMLFTAHVGGAPVVDADGRLVGVVSERDLLEKEAALHLRWRGAGDATRRRTARTVGEICTRPARTTTAEVSLRAVARRFIDEHVARLVVMEGDEVCGIVTRHDVLRVLLRDDEDLREEVLAVLRQAGWGKIDVEVHEGAVRVQGMVGRRTQRNEVLGIVELVDGVVDVDAHILWRRDDINPAASHPHV